MNKFFSATTATIVVSVFGLVLLLPGCSDVSRDEWLDGQFNIQDANPPAIVFPDANEPIINADSEDIIFTWEKRKSAGYYDVQIASDADFNAIVLERRVFAPRFSLALAAQSLASGQYHWRVWANTSTTDSWSTARFDVFDSALYVHCPQALGATCSDTNRDGTLGKPFRTLAGALAAALGKGVRKVKVAWRGNSGAAYPEAISLVEGVDILGGYAEGFSQRDASAYPTRFDSPTPYGIYGSNIQRATLVEGLVVVPNGNFAGTTNTGVQLDSCGAGLTLRNNNIRAIVGNDPVAVRFTNSSSSLLGNTIIVGNSTANSATGVAGSVTGQALFANNVISPVAITGANTYGISVTGAIKLINNTISTGFGSAVSIGVQLSSAAGGSIVQNNIIFTPANAGSKRMFQEGDASADPSLVTNNNFFDAGSGGSFFIYADYVGTGGNCGTDRMCYANLADVNDATKTTQAAASSAANNTLVNDSGDQLFQSLRGVDNDINATADNLWQLKAANATTCAVTTGGLALSSFIQDDFEQRARTTAIPSSCSLSGGEGWSMGAFEQELGL